MHSRVSSEGRKTQTGTAQIYNWDLFLDVERFECLSPKTLSLPNGKGAHGHILSNFSFSLAFSIEDSVVQKILMPQCRISSRYIIKMSSYRQRVHVFNNRTLFSVSTQGFVTCCPKAWTDMINVCNSLFLCSQVLSPLFPSICPLLETPSRSILWR